MKTDRVKQSGQRPGEASFTILETMVAVGVMLAVVLEVVGTQGNIASFAGYSRRLTEASWLAKRVMSQVEYHWHNREFKQLDISVKDQEFEFDEKPSDTEYTYNLTIENWDLPIFDILSGGGPQTDEEDDDYQAEPAEQQGLGGGLPGVEQLVNTLFDGEILKIAHVEVFWPEGARRNSVRLTYLLTNQRALDAYIGTKKKVYEKLQDKVEEELTGKKKRDGGDKPKPDERNPDRRNPGGDNRRQPDN